MVSDAGTRKEKQRQWVVKENSLNPTATAQAEEVEKEDQQVYSRSFLLKTLETHTWEPPRHRTPSTSATDSDNEEKFQVKLAPKPAPPEDAFSPTARDSEEKEAPGTVTKQSSGGKGRTQRASKRGGSELQVEAPEFFPLMFPAWLPAQATAAQHFAAREAAEKAAKATAIAIKPASEAQKQIEYYFSVTNICHDMYLRSLMDEEGWVKLEDIVKFNKLKALSVDVPGAADALSESQALEMSADGLSVRIANVALRDAFPWAPYTSTPPLKPAQAS